MTGPLRVLHLNTERGWRGGERQTFWLARALRDLGHTSVVAAWPGSPLAERAAGAGLEVHGAQPRFPVDPLSAWSLAREIGRGRFDVLHAHTGNALTQGALAPRPSRAALVGSKRVDRPSHAGAVTSWKYRRADALIAVSAHVRDVLVAGGAPRDRVRVVPDGVDLSRIMVPAPAEVLRSFGVRGSGPLVVMAAALVPTKAPLVFVRAVAAALKQGAGCEALLVGDGPLRAAVESERQRCGLEGALHLAGWRDDADAIIAAADIVALTSKGEGQGSVLLDAMQCGRAVIATSVGGIPEMVLDGATGLLVDVDDHEAFGAGLARLSRDAVLREKLGAAGRERVRQFSLERTAERTLDAYRAALSHRRPGNA